MSWQALQAGAPELAKLGEDRFASELAYLATIKKDGSPRVHPVTPILSVGRLFLFMEPTSPKGHDLRRDGRYALHASVLNPAGEGGEFLVAGTAHLNEDEATRALAVDHATYDPVARYILFELNVDEAASTLYGDQGRPRRQHWRRTQQADSVQQPP